MVDDAPPQYTTSTGARGSGAGAAGVEDSASSGPGAGGAACPPRCFLPMMMMKVEAKLSER